MAEQGSKAAWQQGSRARQQSKAARQHGRVKAAEQGSKAARQNKAAHSKLAKGSTRQPTAGVQEIWFVMLHVCYY
jgi:hypothetical protein